MDLTESDDNMDATRVVRKELGHEDYVNSMVSRHDLDTVKLNAYLDRSHRLQF